METQTKLMYRKYTVDIELMNGLASGTPVNQGLAAAHALRFSADVSNALKLSKKNEGEVSDQAIAEYMAQCSSVFLLDDQGIYIRGYQFNAMLKDAAQRMKVTLTYRGLGNTIRDGGLLFPDKVYLGVEPSIIERAVKPDNSNANIKIFQVAEGVKLSLPAAVLNNGDLPDKLFRQIWVVAQGQGIGANRHLGYGRFLVRDIKREKNWDYADFWKKGIKETSPVAESV